jgi:hypothetical protein
LGDGGDLIVRQVEIHDVGEAREGACCYPGDSVSLQVENLDPLHACEEAARTGRYLVLVEEEVPL